MTACIWHNISYIGNLVNSDYVSRFLTSAIDFSLITNLGLPECLIFSSNINLIQFLIDPKEFSYNNPSSWKNIQNFMYEMWSMHVFVYTFCHQAAFGCIFQHFQLSCFVKPFLLWLFYEIDLKFVKYLALLMQILYFFCNFCNWSTLMKQQRNRLWSPLLYYLVSVLN